MNEQSRSLVSLGLMSGTSADGIDAAVIETGGRSRPNVLGGLTIPYAADFKQQLIEIASAGGDVREETVEQVGQELTRLHADAVLQASATVSQPLAEIDVIGFHGHTILHQPAQAKTRQIGDGELLARMTGRPVVSDFRSADMMAGGQGAPLAPLYHQAIVGDRPGTHLVLNLGGVGNVTWIHGDRIVAGDTGPGCGLLDAWVQRRTGQPFDRDGLLARDGTVDNRLVEDALSANRFFAEPLPKSADRFDFDAIDVSELSTQDGAATLCAITIEAVVRSSKLLDAWPTHCWVTGGGRHHPVLMERLRASFQKVAGVSELGHSEDLLEAECFAWLAVRHLRGLPTSLPETTGVSQPTCGGRLALSKSESE